MNLPYRQASAPDDEGRLRLLLDAVTDYAIYMLSPTGHVTSWNAGARRFKGYEQTEILGEHFSRFYTEEDRASGLPERALRVAATEGRFEHDGWRVRKDGSRFWASVVIDRIASPDGTLLGFAKVTRDITERKQTEEALRRSEERFQLLVQGVTDYAIYMLDPEGRVTNWNTGAQRIKGYQEAEVVGEHFSRFYTDEDRAAGLPALALETATRDGRFEREGWRLRKDGTRFWAGVVIDAIHGPDGQLLGFAKVTRDLTERKQTQDIMEQTRAALFQSQKMEAIGQLTGGIAHDFNNLLTVVVNGLDLLNRTVRDAKSTKLIDNMQRAAERGRMLNQQLLAFARRQPLRPEEANVNAVIAGFEAVLRRALGEGLRMEVALAPRLRNCRIDIPQFEAALLNLVVNARDAMADTGTAVRIATQNVTLAGERANRSGLQPGAYISVIVSDDGPGMAQEVRARALEPFFTTKEVGKGTGLGLSQVYGFVTQCGGTLVLESEIGRGAKIQLFLPSAGGGDTEDESHEESTRPGRDKIGTVLILEDEADVLEMAVQIFESLGYDVLTATNAAAALEVLRHAEQIDVLFSDIVMPGMNGADLARDATKLRPDLKILLASGYPVAALQEKGLPPDVSFISKPYRWTELDEKLRVLRSRNSC